MFVILALPSLGLSSTLVFQNAVQEGVGGVTGLEAGFDLTVSPDGKHVYALNGRHPTDTDASIGVFSRDAVTGQLSSVARYEMGVDFPILGSGVWNAWLSPDGAHMYLGTDGFGHGGILVFARDGTSGDLSFLEALAPAPSGEVFDLAFSPAGDFVYVGSTAVEAYARDPATGSLTLVDTFSSSNLAAEYVHMSPDGSTLYALHPGGWLRSFALDPATGALDARENLYLSRPHHEYLTTSIDGAFVYVGGSAGKATFAVAQGDGKLSFVERQRCGSVGQRLKEVPTPDGTRLLSAGAVYGIDPASGARMPLEALDDDVTDAGFSAASAWDMSPDGRHAYMLISGGWLATFSIGPSPAPVDRDCELEGKTLVVRNVGPGGLVAAFKWKTKGELPLPVEASPNDPRCGQDPLGTVRATIRMASAAANEDTGPIALPCQHWRTIGSSNSLSRGYKYQDKGQLDGPCRKVLLKAGKIVSAVCDNKGTSPLTYSLTEGVSQEQVDIELKIGLIRSCTRFSPHNGADGSNGSKFLGKNAPRPGACAAY